MKHTINLLFLASLRSLCGIQNLKASQGFKWNTNVTIDAAFLAANPGPYDSLVINWSGSGSKPTLTIDLAGGTLPMVYKTGYIKAINQAKLIIKNCKIEGMHARKLWQGIIPWNASTSVQNTSLEMENCTISYAWDGVLSGSSLNSLIPPPSNGALVNIKSSVFYNCRTGVTFAPCDFSNASVHLGQTF
jgi:hypothetical protein